MKKKTLLISIISLVLVGGGIALWFYFKKSKDLAAYIPKDAVMIVKLDIPGIVQKVDFSKIKKLESYEKIRSQMANDNKTKKLFDNFMNDPSMIGISFQEAPYMFLGIKGEGKDVSVYSSYIFGISDPKKLSDFLRLASGLSDIQTEGTVKYISMDDDIEDGGIFFNDKVAMVVVKIEGKKIDCKSIAMDLFKLKQDGSILSDKSFTDFQKNQMDISMYINKPVINDMVEGFQSDYYMNSSLTAMKQALKLYPTGFSMNFEEDAIKLKTYAGDGQEMNGIMKDNGLSADDLKYFAPDGKPLAYMSLNMDFKKYMDYVMDIMRLDGSRSSDEIADGIDEISSEMGVSKDDLFNTLAGNFSISLTGFERKSYLYTDPYYLYDEAYQPEPEMRTKMVPIFVAHATMGNPKAYNYLVTKAQEENKYQNGVIMLPTNIATNEFIYVAKKGNELMMSNKMNYINDFKNGVSWTSLDPSCKSELASVNPMAFYCNLQYDKYKDVIEENASQVDRIGMKMIMKEMECATAFMSKKDSEMALLMTSKKENAIWRIIELVDEAVLQL